MKYRHLPYLLPILLLTSCAQDNSSSGDPSCNNDYLLVSRTEEEQFEMSKLVVLAKVKDRGDVETINCSPYTIYYLDILEFYKGSENIAFAYFLGDTGPNSGISISIEEKMTIGETYKLYLREKDGKYFTTAGHQSIIKQ